MNEFFVWFFDVYVLIISMAAFVAMGVDKKRAKDRSWRIRERTLLLLAAIGGGIGEFAGMLIFRHKTKHIKFKILVPAFAIIYAVILIAVNFS